MERRDFMLRAGQFVLAGTSISVFLACGSDEENTGPTGPQVDTRIDASFSNNHGHSLDLDEGQLAAGTPLELTLSTANGHVHELNLTPAEVDELLAGNTLVRATSTDDGHFHTATLVPPTNS